jgi:L-cysteine:1D-myo-inositol 2-amino-2-deoxy-alpha-D-glucopyranoside ligase
MKLFNSLSGKTEDFKTLKEREVKMYVCGITPYDTTHLGHAFVYTVFDALNRYLEFKGYKVSYTQNVTDIDDDVLKRAKRDNRDWRELGDFWTEKFLNDLKAINVRMPDNYIKATDAMDEIIEIIRVLQEKQYAYESGGNVYFAVKKFPGYGNLSKYGMAEMTALLKERGGDPEDPRKKDSLDFLLWQKSAEDEPSWDSPWGKGRPGWHIECSAMIKKTLGEQIDIHGGGFDLIYPHHESELAQSESFSGKSPFVKYWMHIAMVYYRGEKMSKSLGNLVLVSDLLKRYSANAIRLLLLTNHYRKRWEFTQEIMDRSQENMDILETKFKKTEAVINAPKIPELEEDFGADKILRKIIDHPEENPRANKFILELLGFNLD